MPDPPVAADDTASTPVGTDVIVDVLANDSDADGDDIFVVAVTQGSNGAVADNGAAAIEMLGDAVQCIILCASDPYAVVGVQQAYGLQPDLVAGPATNTSAALDLVETLTGIHGTIRGMIESARTLISSV